MKKYQDAINKLVAQLEAHIERLGESETATADDKVDALEGFKDALIDAMDNLEAEWPQ